MTTVVYTNPIICGEVCIRWPEKTAFLSLKYPGVSPSAADADSLLTESVDQPPPNIFPAADTKRTSNVTHTKIQTKLCLCLFTELTETVAAGFDKITSALQTQEMHHLMRTFGKRRSELLLWVQMAPTVLGPLLVSQKVSEVTELSIVAEQLELYLENDDDKDNLRKDVSEIVSLYNDLFSSALTSPEEADETSSEAVDSNTAQSKIKEKAVDSKTAESKINEKALDSKTAESKINEKVPDSKIE